MKASQVRHTPNRACLLLLLVLRLCEAYGELWWWASVHHATRS